MPTVTEIELKLFFSKADLKVLTHCLDRFPSSIAKIPQKLKNHYYDTQDLQLRKWNMGLRVREIGDYKEQTIKTAGSVVGGLHSRPEYNIELSLNKPILNLFPTSIWPEDASIKNIQNTLYCLFNTNFTRAIWHININESLVEVAIDIGKIETDNLSDEICEIEFELLKGNAAVLFDLANEVAKQIPIRLAEDSKAKRGYLLAKQASLAEQSRSSADDKLKFEARDFSSTNSANEVIEQLQYLLSLWLKIDKQAEIKFSNNQLDRDRELTDLFESLLCQLIDGTKKLALLSPDLTTELEHINKQVSILKNEFNLLNANKFPLIALRKQIEFGTLQLSILKLCIVNIPQ